MDAFEYTFTSKTGDTYIVRILNDGMRFLSSEMISIIEKANVEVWGIYLNRIGSYKNITGIRELSVISKQIYSFFMTHDNAILYYVCDDIAEVPMNARKKAEGFTVQYYRNRLFTSLFQKLQGLIGIHVVDLPIYIDACGNGDKQSQFYCVKNLSQPFRAQAPLADQNSGRAIASPATSSRS